MTYDNWSQPTLLMIWNKRCPKETPKFDDEDVCLWCGANPTQACQWAAPWSPIPDFVPT